MLQDILTGVATRAAIEGAFYIALGLADPITHPGAVAGGIALLALAGVAGGAAATISANKPLTAEQELQKRQAKKDKAEARKGVDLGLDEGLEKGRADRERASRERQTSGTSSGPSITLIFSGAPLLTEAELGARIEQATQSFKQLQGA